MVHRISGGWKERPDHIHPVGCTSQEVKKLREENDQFKQLLADAILDVQRYRRISRSEKMKFIRVIKGTDYGHILHDR
jgi:hypothetical protein